VCREALLMRARSAERKGRAGGFVLCMLVVAVANAPRFPHQMHTLQTTLICVSLSAEDAS